MELDLNANGYLNNPGDWNEEVMYELARREDLELTDEHIKYIMSAREYYDEYQVVPPIREFAKLHGMDRKAERLYELFPRGPMKMLSKIGGNMPQPTGCV